MNQSLHYIRIILGWAWIAAGCVGIWAFPLTSALLFLAAGIFLLWIRQSILRSVLSLLAIGGAVIWLCRPEKVINYKPVFSDTTEEIQTVYLTPTGTKYHYSKSCAGKNAIPTSKEDAVKGHGPCGSCVN